jgi:hypothetical protein
MDCNAATIAELWEYRVIHLNVEPGPTQASQIPPREADGAAAEDSANSRPVFSDAFLKKEFPQFYEARPDGASPVGPSQPGQALHPAQQLQTFLNGHGAQGWELIGLFPVGALSMLFFRRRLARTSGPATTTLAASQHPDARPVAAASAVAGTAATAEPAPAAAPPSETPPIAPPVALPQTTPLLETLQARLAALELALQERGVGGGAPAPSSKLQRRSPARANGSSTPLAIAKGGSTAKAKAQRRGQHAPAGHAPPLGSSVEQLSARHLASLLASETPRPSSAAASALGLRSAASLANHGARHGYRPGLCKHGSNGWVAVYSGLGAPQRGGNAPRLWIVVPAERLDG